MKSGKSSSGAGVGLEVRPAVKTAPELLALLPFEGAEQLTRARRLLHSQVLYINLRTHCA